MSASLVRSMRTSSSRRRGESEKVARPSGLRRNRSRSWETPPQLSADSTAAQATQPAKPRRLAGRSRGFPFVDSTTAGFANPLESATSSGMRIDGPGGDGYDPAAAGAVAREWRNPEARPPLEAG